jgi:hypothetical protein
MRNRLTLYRKLKDYLAVLNFVDYRILAIRRQIRWMPQLKESHRRLTLREFLDAYCK